MTKFSLLSIPFVVALIQLTLGASIASAAEDDCISTGDKCFHLEIGAGVSRFNLPDNEFFYGGETIGGQESRPLTVIDTSVGGWNIAGSLGHHENGEILGSDMFGFDINGIYHEFTSSGSLSRVRDGGNVFGWIEEDGDFQQTNSTPERLDADVSRKFQYWIINFVGELDYNQKNGDEHVYTGSEPMFSLQVGPSFRRIREKTTQNGAIRNHATNALSTSVVNNEKLTTNYYGWTFAGEFVKNLDEEWAITGTGAFSVYRAKSKASTSYADDQGNSFSRSLSKNKNTTALNLDVKVSHKLDASNQIAVNIGIDSLRYAPKVNYSESKIDDGDLFGYAFGVRFIRTFNSPIN